MSSVIRDAVDRVMSGSWTFTGSVVLPDDCVNEDNLTAAALLPADNLVARFPAVGCKQAPGSDVVAQTEIIHIAKYAGIVASVEAVADTVPDGASVDKKVTIDVQKSTGGAAWASILTATFDIDDGETDKVAVAGTLDAAKDDYSAGDIFKVVVTVSGSTGNQAQGLCVTVFFEEQPTS